jgi:hypothetical protein
MQLKRFLAIAITLFTLHLSYAQNSTAGNAPGTTEIQKLLSDYATSVNNMDTILAAKVQAIGDSNFLYSSRRLGKRMATGKEQLLHQHNV